MTEKALLTQRYRKYKGIQKFCQTYKYNRHQNLRDIKDLVGLHYG